MRTVYVRNNRRDKFPLVYNINIKPNKKIIKNHDRYNQNTK